MIHLRNFIIQWSRHWVHVLLKVKTQASSVNNNNNILNQTDIENWIKTVIQIIKLAFSEEDTSHFAMDAFGTHCTEGALWVDSLDLFLSQGEAKELRDLLDASTQVLGTQEKDINMCGTLSMVVYL